MDQSRMSAHTACTACVAVHAASNHWFHTTIESGRAGELSMVMRSLGQNPSEVELQESIAEVGLPPHHARLAGPTGVFAACCNSNPGPSPMRASTPKKPECNASRPACAAGAKPDNCLAPNAASHCSSVVDTHCGRWTPMAREQLKSTSFFHYVRDSSAHIVFFGLGSSGRSLGSDTAPRVQL